MRQIFALIFIATLIVLIGCNVSTLFHSPVSVLCAPLSLGFAILFIIWALERNSNPYSYNYYNNVGSLLTDRMYEKDTIGAALVGRAGAAIGTGLLFLIVHGILNILPTATETVITNYTTPTSAISNFLIDAAIISLVLFFAVSLKYIKKLKFYRN